MDIGENRDSYLASNLSEYFKPLLDPKAPVCRFAGPVGFVKAALEDEGNAQGGRDFLQRSRRIHLQLFRLHDAGPRNQKNAVLQANVNFLDQLRTAGLVISALTQREQLTEMVELPQAVHPWFIGVQFHPEFKSTPWNGHPLFNAFIKAALDHQAAGKVLKAVA